MNRILFCFIIILFPLINNAQEKSSAVADTAKAIHPLNLKTYTILLLNDFKLQATAPFKIKPKQALHLGEFAVVTAGLFVADGSIDNVVKKLRSQSSVVNYVSPRITNFGSNWGIYTVGAFGVYGLIFNDKKAKVTALLASQAFITSGVWTEIGKFITGRERPSASYNGSQLPGGKWNWFTGIINNYEETKKLPGASYDAFPSGHTSSAFSFATVFAKMYSDKPAIPIIAYSVATLVGLSRLTQHAHWSSDVFVGAALGYLCGSQVVSNYRNTFKLHAPTHKHKDVKLSMDYFDKKFLAGVNYKL